MPREFQQIEWTDAVERDLRRLLEIAVAEDTATTGDLTALALVSEQARGAAVVHLRRPGVVCGIVAVQTVLNAVDPALRWEAAVADGAPLRSGDPVGTVAGPARSLLTAERPMLNLLGRLSGIATLTRRYADEIAGTGARIYDTRKTTPGWRRLEKYAVRCGGGRNHRTGLFDAVLIKDNHLALGQTGSERFSPAEAVERCRKFLRQRSLSPDAKEPIVEIEVDTLEQLREVLPTGPDIVLLDNMSPKTLAEAVALRNVLRPECELEASGGISLETVRAVAETGVERISVGALTHSAVSLDLGLDWEEI